jgi:hypothetical protein
MTVRYISRLHGILTTAAHFPGLRDCMLACERVWMMGERHGMQGLVPLASLGPNNTAFSFIAFFGAFSLSVATTDRIATCRAQGTSLLSFPTMHVHEHHGEQAL